MSFGGDSPDVEPAAPTPTRDSTQVVQAQNRERQKRIAQSGRRSTMLSARNAAAPTVASTQLLGH